MQANYRYEVNTPVKAFGDEGVIVYRFVHPKTYVNVYVLQFKNLLNKQSNWQEDEIEPIESAYASEYILEPTELAIAIDMAEKRLRNLRLIPLTPVTPEALGLLPAIDSAATHEAPDEAYPTPCYLCGDTRWVQSNTGELEECPECRDDSEIAKLQAEIEQLKARIANDAAYIETLEAKLAKAERAPTEASALVDCPVCHGDRWLMYPASDKPFLTLTCPACAGSGVKKEGQ